MRTQLAAACAGLALMAATAMAQPVQKFYVVKNKTGKVEFFSSNYGIFGLDVAAGRAGFYYPRGSDKAYIFGAGLWFGARKMVEGSLRPMTFITYNPNSGASWATPSEYYSDSLSALPYMYNSEEFSRATGSYVSGTKASWPLWLNSGMEATPMHPGIFEPEVHERTVGGGYSAPAFIPGADEQIISRYNDRDLERYERRDSSRLGFPLGLEIQQNTLAWGDGLYAPVVLIQYQIVNTSSDTLHDCIVAQASDPELGMPDNDRARYHSEQPELRAAYVWDDLSMGSYGALGMSIIEAPMVDANGFIDRSNRNGYRTEGRVGAFPDWIIETDPSISGQRYEFMSIPNMADGSNANGDKRALLASTKFSMRPGDTAYFTVAYVVLDTIPAQGKAVVKNGGDRLAGFPSGGVNVSQLETVVNSLLEDYYERGRFSSLLPSSAPRAEEGGSMSLSALPNPTSASTTLRMALPKDLPTARLHVTNGLGQSVLVRDLGYLPAGTYDEIIDVSPLPAGLYFARLESGANSSVIRFVVTR